MDYLRLARKSLERASLKLTRDLDSLGTDLKLYLDLSLDLELTSETWYLFWQDLRLENCFCKNWDLVGLAPKELTLDLSRLTRLNLDFSISDCLDWLETCHRSAWIWLGLVLDCLELLEEPQGLKTSLGLALMDFRFDLSQLTWDLVWTWHWLKHDLTDLRPDLDLHRYDWGLESPTRPWDCFETIEKDWRSWLISGVRWNLDLSWLP